MKKVLLIGIIIVIFFLVYIFVKKPLGHYLTVKQIECDILNFLNKKDDKHISEEGKRIYNYLINIRNTECNVSSIVGYYFDVADEIFQAKAFKRDIRKVKFPQEDEKDYYINRVKVGWAGSVHKIEDFTEIQKAMGDKEVTNYNQDTFRISLSKKLEKILYHKSDELNKDWYMDASNGYKIELPYNCYFEYSPGREINIDKTEQIYLNSEFTKCELEKTDTNFIFNDRGLTAKVIYKDNGDNIGNIWFVVGLEDVGEYIKLTPHLKAQYIEQGKNSESYIMLKSHDVDEVEQEVNEYSNWITSYYNYLSQVGYDHKILNYITELYDNGVKASEVNGVLNRINSRFAELKDNGLSLEEVNESIIREFISN